MSSMSRCRSCGFVTAEGRLKDVCPACGAPRKMLEPWADPVSERRRALLELGLHPMVIHFTVAFAASAFALSLFALAFPRFLAGLATDVLIVMTAVLPLAVLAGWVAGAFDGRIRFRRVRTPLLVQKMIMGGSVFLETLATAALLFGFGLEPPWVRVATAVLLGLALGTVAVLAKIGVGLRDAKLPG
jgi:rRNA maturation protein Nop10